MIAWWLRCSFAILVTIGLSTAAHATPHGAPDQAAHPERISASRQAYIDSLVARARHVGLADTKMWRRLLHYRSTLFGGWHSEADGSAFFLSENGKSDPTAELEATIRVFFGPEPTDARLPHPFCRFPARLAWLNAKLSFDFDRVPRRVCPRFQDYHRRLDPHSLVLVFSSYYLNNPASAFGHTFLRVNKKGRNRHTEGLELLDYGIDFSANVDTPNALIYAVKGLTGLFPGVFRKIPYYLKVREYNDYESRDLWEYELNLTEQEVSMVVAHLWELGWNYFDYFYLSENCSYHILAALEVASPRINLLYNVGWPAIPADTVKALQASPGLVRSVHYRPSNRSQARARTAQLSATELDMLAELMEAPGAPFPPELTKEARARVLDAALDLANFRYARDLVRKPGEEEEPEGAALTQRLLERRASLLIESEQLDVEPPVRKMPHMGHDSGRIGLGTGYLEARGLFQALDFRLALHDLADPAAGYPDYSAIEFSTLRLRYYLEEATVSVEDFSLVHVTSLTPLERWQKKWSWTVRAGGTRLRDEGCDGCFAGLGEFGAGISVAPFGPAWVTWLFADAQVLAPVGGGLLDKIRAGIGPFSGMRFRIGENFSVLGKGRLHWLPEQEPRWTWEADAVLRWQYQRHFALGAEARLQPNAASGRVLSLIYF